MSNLQAWVWYANGSFGIATMESGGDLTAHRFTDKSDADASVLQGKMDANDTIFQTAMTDADLGVKSNG